jgi:hypothetical protein
VFRTSTRQDRISEFRQPGWPLLRPAADRDQAAPAHPGADLRTPLFGRAGRTLAELFPEVHGASRTGASRWHAAQAAVVPLAVLLGAGVLLERQAGDPPWHTLWAEDGRVFLPDALAHPLSSLVTPYAGYLQLVPRLIADGAGHLLPPGQVAAGEGQAVETIILSNSSRQLMAIQISVSGIRLAPPRANTSRYPPLVPHHRPGKRSLMRHRDDHAPCTPRAPTSGKRRSRTRTDG